MIFFIFHRTNCEIDSKNDEVSDNQDQFKNCQQEQSTYDVENNEIIGSPDNLQDEPHSKMDENLKRYINYKQFYVINNQIRQ